MAEEYFDNSYSQDDFLELLGLRAESTVETTYANTGYKENLYDKTNNIVGHTLEIKGCRKVIANIGNVKINAKKTIEGYYEGTIFAICMSSNGPIKINYIYYPDQRINSFILKQDDATTILEFSCDGIYTSKDKQSAFYGVQTPFVINNKAIENLKRVSETVKQFDGYIPAILNLVIQQYHNFPNKEFFIQKKTKQPK